MMNANGVVPNLPGSTRLLRILLFLGAAMGIVAFLSSITQLKVMGGNFPGAEAGSNASSEGAIRLLPPPLHMFTAVIFGLWIYRANTNGRSLWRRRTQRRG